MRAIVLGACGAVGREVSAGLAEAGAFDDVVLADLDAARLRTLARELGCSARRLDATDGPALRRAIRDVGVLVNCTTYHLGVRMLRAAIAERVDYVDLGGLHNTPRQLQLHDRARRAGIRAVIGCGATPGLSNVLVRRAAEELDVVEQVHISFASLRDPAPSPGLFDTLLDEFRPDARRFVWRDGALREVGPFEGRRRVRFPPPVGPQEVFYVPHSEMHTVPRFLGDGLREVTVRGTWRPTDMSALQAFGRYGMTSSQTIRVDGARVRPLDVLRAVVLRDPPSDADAPCAFFLDVEVSGAASGEPTVIRQRATHPAGWGASATGRMTAVPTIAGAVALGRGEVHGAGVFAPEEVFAPEPFLRQIRRHGVRVTRSRRPVVAGRAPL